MKKGCCLGCLAVGVILVALMVVAGVVIEQSIGIISPAERVDLAAAYSGGHAVAIVANPNAPNFGEVYRTALRDDPRRPEWFMPHEAALFYDVDVAGGTRELSVAVSPKRFSGLLSWFVPDPENWHLDGELEVQEADFQENGAFLWRATGPLSADAQEQAREIEPDSGASPIALEGGHIIEIIVDNRQGEAFLVLHEALLEGLEEDADAADDAADEVSDDAILSPADWDLLLRAASTLRLTVDAAADATLQFQIDLTCRDTKSADGALALLRDLKDRLGRWFAKEEAVFEGSFARVGKTITGILTLRGYDEVFIEFIEDARRSWEDQFR